jgi:hypothetical protein
MSSVILTIYVLSEYFILGGVITNGVCLHCVCGFTFRWICEWFTLLERGILPSQVLPDFLYRAYILLLWTEILATHSMTLSFKHSITGWSSCGVNPHEIQSIIEHVGKTVSWVLCSYSFYYESLFSEANIGHLFQVVLVTARPLYRRNTKHAHEKKNHEGSDHNLKSWRDGSQSSKHTLQQSRSMKWKIHHYKPVQVMV